MEDDEDYNEYNGQYDYKEDSQFVDEWNVGIRTGGKLKLGEDVDTILVGNKFQVKYYDKLQKRLMMESMSDTDKFLYLINIFSNYVFAEEIGKIEGSDKAEIIDMVTTKIKHVKYKNPIAFLIGYYCFSKKKGANIIHNIDMDKVTFFLNVLREKEIEGITKEDIIRYTRYIHSLKV